LERFLADCGAAIRRSRRISPFPVVKSDDALSEVNCRCNFSSLRPAGLSVMTAATASGW
jgi:hypothetical protein